MVQALEEGWNVATTADVPKRSRVAGLGIIMLARESGRPIMPFAMVTSRFIRLKNWDSSTINLPFGRGALVGIEHVYVPPDADAETMEKLRLQVEALLNEATRRAYKAVGRPEAALANPLPMTLRVYRKLSYAMVPLSPALISRRLKLGKEDPERFGERRGLSADIRPTGPLVWIHGASVGEVLA